MFCRNKYLFVTTNTCFNQTFVATKIILVAAAANDAVDGTLVSTQELHLFLSHVVTNALCVSVMTDTSRGDSADRFDPTRSVFAHFFYDINWYSGK